MSTYQSINILTGELSGGPTTGGKQLAYCESTGELAISSSFTWTDVPLLDMTIVIGDRPVWVSCGVPTIDTVAGTVDGTALIQLYNVTDSIQMNDGGVSLFSSSARLTHAVCAARIQAGAGTKRIKLRAQKYTATAGTVTLNAAARAPGVMWLKAVEE